MSKLKETKRQSLISDEAVKDEKGESRSSIDRLADFTRRIIAVPKSDVSSDFPSKGTQSG